MDAIHELCRLLEESGAKVLFGLRAQGHTGTVEFMLSRGSTWNEIGAAIGWHGPAVQQDYELEHQLFMRVMKKVASARLVGSQYEIVLGCGHGLTRMKSQGVPEIMQCPECAKAETPEESPALSLLVKLGSIAVHAEELLSSNGHEFDKAALDTLVSDPEVTAWLKAMGAKAYLPLKRP